jgi:hypothetical protein
VADRVGRQARQDRLARAAQHDHIERGVAAGTGSQRVERGHAEPEQDRLRGKRVLGHRGDRDRDHVLLAAASRIQGIEQEDLARIGRGFRQLASIDGPGHA